MGQNQSSQLANYELPYLPNNSILFNIQADITPNQAYQTNHLPKQYEIKSECLSINPQNGWSNQNMPVYNKPDYFTVLTYNIWFQEHNLHIRYPAILRMLYESEADFICLQEVTPKFMKQLRSAAKLYPKSNYYMPNIEIGWYDTLILSKYPCLFYKKTFSKTEMERSNLIAIVQFAQKGKQQFFKFAINCVHLESSQSPEPRIQQLKQIKELNSNADFSIIAGDFNFSDGCKENQAIDKYIDVWKTGKKHFSKFASQQMKEKGYTMPANPHSPAVRLDHIIYQAKQKKEKKQFDQITIFGDFTIPYYEKDHYSKIFSDFIVRTPSDHFGLIAKIILQ